MKFLTVFGALEVTLKASYELISNLEIANFPLGSTIVQKKIECCSVILSNAHSEQLRAQGERFCCSDKIIIAIIANIII